MKNASFLITIFKLSKERIFSMKSRPEIGLKSASPGDFLYLVIFGQFSCQHK